MDESRFWWSDARASKLRVLWNAGFSASEIGDHLGVSRSAVLGKADRLGLPYRVVTTKPCNPQRLQVL